MSTFRTPNFLGQKAVILHRMDDNIRRLVRHLTRLGIESKVIWPDFDIDTYPANLVFFDGDNGYDGLFPWSDDTPPVPLIALISSEAPGRIEWILSQNTSAHLIKPVQSSGVFSTLVIAYAKFEEHKMQLALTKSLENRIAQRPAVFKALLLLMNNGNLDEDVAFAIIRSAAMSSRQSVEDFCIGFDQSHMVRLLKKISGSKDAAS